MIRSHRHAHRVTRNFREAKFTPQFFRRRDRQRDVQFFRAQLLPHFFRRQIMQRHAHLRLFLLKLPQRRRQNLHRERRRVADVKLAPFLAVDVARFVHRRFHALQNFARLRQKNFSRVRELERFRAAFKKRKTDFIFEVADLSAQARLRDVQLQRGAGDIFLPGHGDEITEMAQFHAGRE